jgi:hypothetical protein
MFAWINPAESEKYRLKQHPDETQARGAPWLARNMA